MLRRGLRRWTSWLLPLLVARLLVPAGFMVTMSGGEFAIVLCSGSAPVPAPGHAVRHHHDVDLDEGAFPDHATHRGYGGPASIDSHATPTSSGSTVPAHGGSLCPFALASGGALWPAVAAVAELPRPLAVVPQLHSDPAWIAPSVLIDRIRSPPVA